MLLLVSPFFFTLVLSPSIKCVVGLAFANLILNEIDFTKLTLIEIEFDGT